MRGKLAFSYLAFSTADQADGRSTGRQESAADDWAKAHGFTLAPSRRFRDEGVSRFNGKARMSGALSRFLALCGTDAVPAGSVLIIEDFDRLSRENADDAWELFRKILLAGVEIVVLSLDRWFKRDSLRRFEDRLLVQACQHRAHSESATKALRSKDIWADRRRRAARGEGGYGRLPTWIVRGAGGRLELDPERAETIRLMARLSLEGQGPVRIATALSKGPLSRPCWLPSGEWHAAAVRNILGSEAVWGAYTPHSLTDERKSVPCGPLVRGHYPAVLTEDEAAAVRRSTVARKLDRGRPAARGLSILRRLVWDAETGAPLCLIGTGRARTVNYLARRWEGRRQYVVPYPTLEALVLRAVQEWTPDALTPRAGPADRRRQADCLAELGAIEADRAVFRAELSQRGRAASTVAIVLGQLDALDAREAEVKEALADLEATAEGVPAGALRDAQSLTVQLASLPAAELPDARRRLNARLREVLQGVWVYRRPLTARTAELIVQVWPRAGAMRECRIFLGRPPAGYRPLRTDGADFRHGYPRPKKAGASSAVT